MERRNVKCFWLEMEDILFLCIEKYRSEGPEGHGLQQTSVRVRRAWIKSSRLGLALWTKREVQMCVPIRCTVHKERSKSYKSSLLSSSLSCGIREVRASLFAVNNALEQQSGICHSRATCCSLEAKSFQPLASEHLGKNWSGGGSG